MNDQKLKVVGGVSVLDTTNDPRDVHDMIDKVLKEYEPGTPISVISIVHVPGDKPRLFYAGRMLLNTEMNGVLMSAILENARERQD